MAAELQKNDSWKNETFVIAQTRTPASGDPNSSQFFPDDKGGGTEREYGPDGRARKDVDYGHGHNGAGDPHAHDWDWGKKPPRQPGRPLTPEERKAAKNAFGGKTSPPAPKTAPLIVIPHDADRAIGGVAVGVAGAVIIRGVIALFEAAAAAL